MSDYCVCNYCGCKHLVWEKSCPYCRRISELEAGNDQMKARELGYIQSLRELEAENARLKILADNYCAIAIDSNTEKRKLREAARNFLINGCDDHDALAAAIETEGDKNES